MNGLNVKVVEKEEKNKGKKHCVLTSNDTKSFVNESSPFKLKKIEITMQEIWQQTTPKIHASKKKYKRKNKHQNINE